ncbi:hypothetical protein J2M53_02195 [Arthrobacter sp. zg-ZUI100]|uniref:hypothetical protein n=1 Tax=Arthrobacter jiangjiafuii TaxID=2817475 RepID=UPI001AEE3DF4|nr:hypothetical protein [Arthrobacter jiangjiafuii]MBP3035066.1 hypothetical protein [Arthrobacter jiangjiafuii]
MEHKPAEPQPIQAILDSFFIMSSVGKQSATAARYGRVEARLRQYLETEGWRYLAQDDRDLLGLECAFNPHNAFARLFGAEDLLYTLGGFLEPDWLLPGLQDRRTQISLIPRLVQWLCNCHLLDPRRDRIAIHSTRAAAARARKGPALGGWNGA